MKHRQNPKVVSGAAPVEPAKQMSVKLEEDLMARFERVQVASRRTKKSVLEECLERALPLLEERFKEDLARVAKEQQLPKAA